MPERRIENAIEAIAAAPGMREVEVEVDGDIGRWQVVIPLTVGVAPTEGRRVWVNVYAFARGQWHKAGASSFRDGDHFNARFGHRQLWSTVSAPLRYPPALMRVEVTTSAEQDLVCHIDFLTGRRGPPAARIR